MKLYETMGYVISAENEEIAIEIACEENGLEIEEYKEDGYEIKELPESYWNKDVFMMDTNDEIKFDENGREITKTYKELFEESRFEQKILSKEI